MLLTREEKGYTCIKENKCFIITQKERNKNKIRQVDQQAHGTKLGATGKDSFRAQIW